MKRVFVLIGALAAGCIERVEPEPKGEEVLAAHIGVAHKDWDGILLEFGSPRALPQLSEQGWSHGETADDGNTFRWASESEASFTFTSNREGKHLAWIECEPFVYEGSPVQWIRLSVNGEEPVEVELRSGRERYAVELPLRLGENEVAMRFRYAGDPDRSSGDRRRLAVAFYRFDVPSEGDAPVAGRPGPFSFVNGGILLPSGGRLRLYADLDGAARLRVAADGDVEVTVRSEDRVLSSKAPGGDFTAEGPVEIVLSATDEITIRPELFVSAKEPPAREPNAIDANIVLVFLDGANALRFGPKTTPVLDALAKKSTVYEHAVSQAVYTIASIGSVLTGQYPERHQSVSFADKLRADAVTFPGVLAEHGYRTAGFSGNAVASSTFGLDLGYEEFFQVWEREDYTGHGDSVLRTFREWLDGVGDDRFFAYVHFREPHFPYNPPAPFNPPSELFPNGMSDRTVVDELNDAGTPPPDDVVERVEALYEGNLSYVDDLVGKLMALLGDDTILIVTADHGEALFEHGFLGHNTQLYEESIRVPLIMKIPGQTPRRVEEVVELVDLAPTILELAGVEALDMQGRSLFDPEGERVAFSRTVWKRARYSARNHRYKLIWDSRTGERELYDLKSDPSESRNLQEDRPFVANYLQQHMFAWLREQEHLRAGAPPPSEAVITEQQREIIESIGYVVPK